MKLATALLTALLMLAAPLAVYAQDPPPVVASTPDATVMADDAGATTVTTTNDVTTVSAPDATTVVVPVGNWITQILDNATAVVAAAIAALVAWAFRALPKTVVDILRTMQVEQLLKRATDYGINVTKGAVKDKALEIHVGNQAVANAVQYVIDNAPGWLIKWMGGTEAVRDKIIARIPMDATVGKVDLK